jgi:hypothetical protein
MGRTAKWFLFGLMVVLGTAALAQNHGLEALLQTIQSLLGEKGTGQIFLNLTAPEEKTLETRAPQEFSELGEEPTVSEEAISAAIQLAIPNKVITVEQAFVQPPKEPGPVGNEFFEGPAD